MQGTPKTVSVTERRRDTSYTPETMSDWVCRFHQIQCLWTSLMIGRGSAVIAGVNGRSGRKAGNRTMLRKGRQLWCRRGLV